MTNPPRAYINAGGTRPRMSLFEIWISGREHSPGSALLRRLLVNSPPLPPPPYERAPEYPIVLFLREFNAALFIPADLCRGASINVRAERSDGVLGPARSRMRAIIREAGKTIEAPIILSSIFTTSLPHD